MVQEAIVEAQHNPETAHMLYALPSCGKRHDPVALKQVRTLFIEAQVPPEFLPRRNSKASAAV